MLPTECADEETVSCDEFYDKMEDEDFVNCICQIQEENGLMIQVSRSYIFLCRTILSNLWWKFHFLILPDDILFYTFSVTSAFVGNMQCVWKSRKRLYQRSMCVMFVQIRQVF